MNYYRYEPDADRFAGVNIPSGEVACHPVLARQAQKLKRSADVADIHYTDVSLAEDWKPPKALGFDDNPTREGDFPSLSNFNEVPVFSQRAWDALQPLIGAFCEALPIHHYSGKPFVLVHVMTTIDCLDVEQSSVERSSDGRICDVDEYAFHEEMLANVHIFKLPPESGGELIVDDVFRQAVQAARLKGLDFRPLPSA